MPGEMSPQPKYILVVDDDDGIRKLVGEILRLEGHRVEMAGDGLQALTLMAVTRPDLILLDLIMPVMDGWTFLQHCRTDPQFAHVPVLVMSTTSKLQETANTLGVQGVLCKPFELEELLDSIDRLLHVLLVRDPAALTA